MKNLLVWTCLFSLQGCFLLAFIPPEECSSAVYADSRHEQDRTTDYRVGKTIATDHGIKVDASQYTVDRHYLDEQTAILEKCLNRKITRCAITVKIAEDYREEPAGQWFPCRIPEGRCAGIYQYPNVLVLPPNLRAYRHELIHLVTHQDHNGPAFQKCDGQ